MPHMDDDATKEMTPSPMHHAALFELRALQQKTQVIIQESVEPNKTEVSELLYRYHRDQSEIEKWTSWYYQLSFMNRTGISLSIIGVAGLSGTIIGLSFPFIAIASTILYYVTYYINEHEQHRHQRGLRFANETISLTHQLSDLMKQFQLIATDLASALDIMQREIEKIVKHNDTIQASTAEHLVEQEALNKLIAAITGQSLATKAAQDEVITVMTGVTSDLQSVKPKIENAAQSLLDFQEAMRHFTTTSQQTEQSERNLSAIMQQLGTYIARSSSENKARTQASTAEVNHTLRSSQEILERIRASRKTGPSEPEKTISMTC